jgi:hypothetical protein
VQPVLEGDVVASLPESSAAPNEADQAVSGIVLEIGKSTSGFEESFAS